MECKLEDIADVTMGQSPKSEFYNNEGEGLPFLQGNRTFGRRFPTFDTFTTKITKRASAGDVIMSVRAPVGDLNITPVDMCLGRGVCGIRMKNGKQDFLFYLMKYNMQQLLNKEAGTVFGSVNRNDINGLVVDIPDEETQDKIASFLGQIDRKIEINEAINRNLSEQADALFNGWFIEKHPFDEIEIASWKEMTLEEVSTLSAGGDKPRNVVDKAQEGFEIPIYSNGISDEGLYGFTDKAKIEEESVTVSARGTIGFVCLRQTPFVPIVRLVTLVPKTFVMTAKYLYLWLKQLNIMGTGTTQQQLTVPDFKKTKILVPSIETISKFTELVNPLYDQILKNKIENVNLSNVRDTLLPRLMSGELDILDLDI